jgi:beta-fructofuranosidase
VVHEISRAERGFVVKPPASVIGRFGEPLPVRPAARIGDWSIDGETWSAERPDGFSYLQVAEMPASCSIEVTVSIAAGTRSAGVILRADESLDRYYQIRLEPSRSRAVFDRWPRPGDEPFTFERPLPDGGDGTHRLRILLDGSCVVAYIDDRVALSCRAYGASDGSIGLFVSEGAATFSGFALREPS